MTAARRVPLGAAGMTARSSSLQRIVRRIHGLGMGRDFGRIAAKINKNGVTSTAIVMNCSKLVFGVPVQNTFPSKLPIHKWAKEMTARITAGRRTAPRALEMHRANKQTVTEQKKNIGIASTR